MRIEAAFDQSVQAFFASYVVRMLTEWSSSWPTAISNHYNAV